MNPFAAISYNIQAEFPQVSRTLTVPKNADTGVWILDCEYGDVCVCVEFHAHKGYGLSVLRSNMDLQDPYFHAHFFSGGPSEWVGKNVLAASARVLGILRTELTQEMSALS